MPATLDQFAAALKKKYPQYQSIPDDQLVKAVLTKYPQYKAQIGGADPGKPTLSFPEERMSKRVQDRIGENVEGMAEGPSSMIRDARSRFLEKTKGGTSPWLAAPQAGMESAYNTAEGLVKGLAGMTGPGLAYRAGIKKEDPANLIGDALSAYLIPEEGVQGVKRGATTAADATKAGSVFGAKTRGAELMNHVDTAAKGIPVNHAPAMEWAMKAAELEKYGWTVPAPVKKFLDMVESRSKGGGLNKIGPGEFVEGEKTSMPLTYEDARNFEVSLGQRIDFDPGNKMNGLMKKMREAIGQETAAALKPYGLDTPYLRAKAEFTKAYGAEAKWGPFGYFGGKLAGYGLGSTVTGHPLMMGYAGGKVGQSMAGSLVRSVTEMGKKGGETAMDEALRRPSGGLSPIEKMKVAGDKVNSLKIALQRNPGDYNAVSQLRMAEDELQAAQKSAWGERYGTASQALSRQGGGGANYTVDQLAEFKKRHGIE